METLENGKKSDLHGIDDFGDLYGSFRAYTERDGEHIWSANDGDVEGECLWGDLVLEELDDEPFDFDTQLAFAETSFLQGFGERIEREGSAGAWQGVGLKGKRSSGYKDACQITDFEEGIERETFALIYGHFALIYDAKNENDPDLKQAVGFIFQDAPFYEGGPTFEECLLALDPDANVALFRIRLMYEMWYVGWRLPPLNPILSPMPRCLVDLMEKRYHQGNVIERSWKFGWTIDDCNTIMNEVWESVGLTAEKLFETISLYAQMDFNAFADALTWLMEERIISANSRQKKSLKRKAQENEWIDLGEERLYLTGENPVRLVEDIYRYEGRMLNLTFMNVFRGLVY